MPNRWILVVLVVSAAAQLSAIPSSSSVTFQRCSNFQATYSGAYLVDKELFLQVKFKAVGALEFASRHLWIHSQFGKPGKNTGCGFKPAPGDEDTFAILHLSGIEHQLVRRHGYEKGIAAMGKLSWHALLETSARFAAVEKRRQHLNEEKSLQRYVGLIPFYGGQGFLHVNMSRVGYKAEYSPKVGNSHTLAGPELKLWQLASVSCSVMQQCGATVVGVCGEEEKANIKAFFATSEAVEAISEECRRDVEFAVLSCDDLPVHLPYLLLQWAQRRFRTASSASSSTAPPEESLSWRGFDGVYFTEADNVLIMRTPAGLHSRDSEVEEEEAEKKTPLSRVGSSAAVGKAQRGGSRPHGAEGGAAGEALWRVPLARSAEEGEFDDAGALRAQGVREFMRGSEGGRPRGAKCYMAPTRYEKKSFGSLNDPFGLRVLIGQNVCNEGPSTVTVQMETSKRT